MSEKNWISTGTAMRIMDLGISPETFRTKFRDWIPWKLTPGGHLRWMEQVVRKVAGHDKKTA